MREILFRGKTYFGDWCMGDLVQNTQDGEVLIISAKTRNNVKHKRVKPETVGQFTGLTDKNGKKIFEGDIVRYGKGIYEWNKKDWEIEVGIIEFQDGAFIINNIYSSDGYNELSCLYHEINYLGKYNSGTLFEVIGNIYDNPELLGE